MKDDSNQTRARLATISDAGAFEGLATGVLRQAEPAYRHLVETGTNANGKPVASPVDGLMLVPSSSPPHLVAVHHTTTTTTSALRTKWLSTSVQKEGDLPKTARWATEARRHLPNAQVTLLLTTNQTVPQDLYLEVQQKAAAHGLMVDIWDQSRLAHHLDTTADGQWLRRRLGIPQARLSADLLRTLSHKSLTTQPRFEQDGGRIPRALDADLARAVKATPDMVFLVAESGRGKSSAARALLAGYVEQGGFGLVLPHQLLETAVTPEAAVEALLRQLEPGLAEGCGTAAVALGTPDKPLLLVVEDVNKAVSPPALVERLVGWSRSSGPDKQIVSALPWRLLCPVWPQVVDRLAEQFRKQVQHRSLYGNPYTPEEGNAAVLLRAREAGVMLSAMQAAETATALGQDPLLIALHEPGVVARPDNVLAGFVDRSLRRIGESTADGLGVSDHKQALYRLAITMLEQRVLSPRWSDLRRWFPNDELSLRALGRLTIGRELLRRDPHGDDDLLVFRHDRVRDQLLADAVARRMEDNTLLHEVLTEPFYAEIVGAALLSSRPLDSGWAARVKEANPLALFHAFRLFHEPTTVMQHAVLTEIKSWLDNPATHSARNKHLLWEASQVLAETDSSLVLQLTERLPNEDWPVINARFRNGDTQAGVLLCIRVEPGVTAPWRDRLIEHAAAHHGMRIIADLERMLRTLPSGKQRIGALNLSGHFGTPTLADAIRTAWVSTGRHPDELSAFIWAAARCGGENPALLLDSMCAEWASLPAENQKGDAAPRDELAADDLRWAINREGMPDSVIRYFIIRAGGEDLAWAISYMLHGLDHPDIMEFMVQTVGLKQNYFFMQTVCEHWDARSPTRGHRLGPASLTRLRSIWTNPNNEDDLRCRAIRLWGGSAEESDLDILRQIDPSSPLYENAVRLRMRLGDPDSHSGFCAMLTMAKRRRGYWWYLTQYVWSPEFLASLDAELVRREQEANRDWKYESTEMDRITADLVQRLPASQADELLARHWVHLRFSRHFVQAALFVATPLSRRLAAQSINECPTPEQLLRHLKFGLYFNSSGPRADQNRLDSLIPYLDLLDDIAIFHLWEHCNRMGLYTWRQQNLDRYLVDNDRARIGLNESALFKRLDNIAVKHFGYVDHWVEQFEKRGDPPGRAIRVATDWLRKRLTIQALQTAANVIVSVGTRSDLKLLEVDAIEPAAEAADIRADSRFALFRRSLQ